MGIGTNRLGQVKWGLLSGLLGLLVALGCQPSDATGTIAGNSITSVDVATKYVDEQEATFHRAFMGFVLKDEQVGPLFLSPEWLQLNLVGETSWEIRRTDLNVEDDTELVTATLSALL